MASDLDREEEPGSRQPSSRGSHRGVATQDQHGAGASAPSSAGRGGYPLSSSGVDPMAGARAIQNVLQDGLDLSFGYTPQQFEKVNLIGSELSEHAIYSLVMSVHHITHLDLRGNKLNAAFGWKLVKAMKKRYFNLEYCNGVPLKALRHNSITKLNLATFEGCHAMYGIEVVGAIFLAHFLRLNSSLTELDFRRNDVQKDGAKALAQSLLGNPQCQLRIVNGMQPETVGKPTGFDFADFRPNQPQLKVIHLPKRQLDDDDFVFLEEWLRRWDCVEDLDISQNLICRDGIRKLAKYVRETNTLRMLNASLLPLDFDGSVLIANAVVENNTLEQAGLPLGPCELPGPRDPSRPDERMLAEERQQMLQDLGVGLWDHPKMEKIATQTSKPPLEWANLSFVRENQGVTFPPIRSASWPRAQMLIYMWFMAAGKPHLEDIRFGAGGNPAKAYPMCASTPKELFPGLFGMVHDMHRTLVKISVALPPDPSDPREQRSWKPVAMELMWVMATRCTQLKDLKLLGYASTPMEEAHLLGYSSAQAGGDSRPLRDWTSTGTAPRWLIEDRLRRCGCKVHWQALYGMLSTMEQNRIFLETFNDISFRGAQEGGVRLRDQPELTPLVMMQCLKGVAVDLQNAAEFPQLTANLTKDADVDAFCDVLRLLSNNPMVLVLNFTATYPRGSNPHVEIIKKQQLRLAGPLSGDGGEQIPRFKHPVILKNNVVSERLLEVLDCHAPLREFGYHSVEQVLPSLYKALCTRERPLPVERIRVAPRWITSCNARKRFSEKQRKYMENIQAALIRSDHFQEISSETQGVVPRDDLAGRQPEEFAALLSGIELNEFQTGDRHKPQTWWKCFPNVKKFLEPDPDEEDFLVPLPVPEDGEAPELERLSLCMCNLRSQLATMVRPDEWPESSKPLWDGPRKSMKPGDWNEHLVDVHDHEQEDDEGDGEEFCRFHWRENLRIGSQQATSQIMKATVHKKSSFAEHFLHDILRSLLSETSTLKSLDLRGCGLNRADAELLMKLWERQSTLQKLNLIPVDSEEAAACTELKMDGTGIEKRDTSAAGEDDMDEEDEEDSAGDAFAQETLEAEYVRLDEGDGLLFESFVKPDFFPALSSLVLRRLEVPLDSTLLFITDTLISMPSLERLDLSDLRVTSRGASLLLQVVRDMAPRLRSLNDLPLAQLVAQRDSQDGGVLELSDSIAWNDYTLGVMASLQLWPVATFPPPSALSSDASQFRLQGRSLTDVGLKGLCIMLRHLAEQERRATAPLSRSASPSLVRIDLSGNLQITDATVADLCHTLQHQSIGASLRHSLRELNVRSCPRLRVRSAFELLTFVNHVREVLREGAVSGKLGTSLQLINGVDMEVLQSAGRSGGSSGRANGPPMLLRTFAELADRPSKHKPALPTMSECDTHFLAGVLHLYREHIPYCHVHVVLPGDLERGDRARVLPPWGKPPDLSADGGMFAQAAVSNDSPFPPPQSVQKQKTAATIQAQLDMARRLFEACPDKTQLRLSVAPLLFGVEDLIAQGDKTVLNTVPSNDRQGIPGAFGLAKQRLQERAKKARRRRLGGADAELPKPLYVNNINSRLLHCCFRTLYGKDDIALEHADLLSQTQTMSLPLEVDITNMFGVATSVDMQHLDLCATHLHRLAEVTEMPVLTHVNLNHNHLGDSGTQLLFHALAAANCCVVHVAMGDNNIGDEGATTIAASLVKLPRLTSLELCDNFIQERGSIALAEAIGGVAPIEEEEDGEEAPPVEPLQVLSLDLRGNRSREKGAQRWAEVVANHPDLKFLCLSHNGIGYCGQRFFTDLVISAVQSTALSVLDLQDNFLHPGEASGTQQVGPPPDAVVEELLQFLPPGEYDPAEVRRAVFIRRHRGGGVAGSGEKKGRQPQQGQRSNQEKERGAPPARAS